MRTTKNFSITIPKQRAAEIDRTAKEQCRSRSSYLVWLIRKDQIAQEGSVGAKQDARRMH
jgi:hypothetical protein